MPDPPRRHRDDSAAEAGRGSFDFTSVRVHAGPAALAGHAPAPAAGTPRRPPPLAISSPYEAAEQEADRAADRVMRGERVRLGAAAAPPLRRKCAGCEGQGGGAGHEAGIADHGPHAVATALRTPGRPLDAPTRAYFEPRFGASFAGVRVHADHAAAAAARSINARAFTLDRRIGFGAGEYAPETRAGRRLLAHELAHVAQAGTGAAEVVYRFPYETKGVGVSRQSVVTWTGTSYWLVRTTERYALTWGTRLANDAEERDAVLAALWAQNPPEAVTAPIELIVPVQARAAVGNAAAPPALLYRFLFTPPLAAGDKPQLAAEFVASGPGSTPVSAPAPAPGYKPEKLEGSFRRFPRAVDAYFAAYPQEHAQLASFLAGTTGPVDQVVRTATTAGSVETHRSVFHVIRTGGSGAQAVLTVTLASETEPAAAVAPASDYRSRDGTDFLLEQLRSSALPQADRLGAVNLPAGLAPDERLAVNLAILGYFKTGARNTEADSLVPVGTGTRIVLFTLRFGVANDVQVERIGEAGTGAGEINMTRTDVTRVNGFPGATAPDATLRSWWRKRFPAGGALKTPAPAKPAPAGAATPAAAPTGSAAGAAGPAVADNAALLAEMNALIAAGSVTTAWFQGNYGVGVMGAAATATHLKSTYRVPAALVADTVDFPAGELATLEIAFQTLSKADLAQLSAVKIGRKSSGLSRTGKVWGPDNISGLSVATWGKTNARTILYFDKMQLNNDALFRGSTASNVLPDVTMMILHEVGHATEYRPGIKAAFDAWTKKNPQVAPTWYAAGNPDSELFAEAYALFHTDPHFLCGAAPLMYAWFLELSRKGSPPAASAKLAPPDVCPA